MATKKNPFPLKVSLVTIVGSSLWLRRKDRKDMELRFYDQKNREITDVSEILNKRLMIRIF